MKNKTTLTIQRLALICSLLLSIGVMTVFHACAAKEDGTFMHCHDVQLVVMGIGLVLAVIYLILSKLPGAVRLVLSILTLVASICLFFIPGNLMPMCMMRTMRCFSVMQPFVRIFSVLLSLLAAGNLYGQLRSSK